MCQRASDAVPDFQGERKEPCMAVKNPRALRYAGLFPALWRFCIRGVAGFPLIWTPLSCGVPMGTGVGADTGASSSAFTVDGLLLLLLFWAGDVFALGPLELVPCWLA